MLQSTNNLGFITVDSIYSNLGKKKISAQLFLLIMHLQELTPQQFLVEKERFSP